MSTHANRCQMTVTGTPGTGTITLNAASSGYKSFADAYGANATVDILITDGAEWEVARNCTYTHSGTTVTRGTREASSAFDNSAISFTSAAVVSVIATADRGRTWDAAALEYTTAAPTTGDVTPTVNTMVGVDLSGLTAARNFTLPAVAAVGDRIGVVVTTGYAGTTYTCRLILKANTGDTLNGVSAAEWSSVIMAGECVIMRCVSANATWVVDYDGRIPINIAATGSYTHTSSGAWQTADFNGVTPQINNGSGFDAANDRIYLRRGGVFRLFVEADTAMSAADKQLICSFRVDATTTVLSRGVSNAVIQSLSMNTALTYPISVGSYIDVQLWQNDSASETMTWRCAVEEVMTP